MAAEERQFFSRKGLNQNGSVGKTARHRGQSTPPSLKARKTGPKGSGPVFLSLGSVSLKSAGAVPPSAAVTMIIDLSM